MEVLSKLGNGKVNIAIKPNKYEETCVTTQISYLNNIQDVFDPIETLRSFKSPVNKIDQSVTLSTPNFTKYDSLLYTFICMIDPTMTLFDEKEARKKIVNMMDIMIKSFDIKCKELGIRKSSKITKESLKENEESVLLYLSKVFDKPIFVNGKLFKGVTQHNTVTSFNIVNNTYQLGETFDLKDCYKIMCEDIDKKLVKEVRDIAQSLGLSLVSLDDGKKKPYGKNELIVAIRSLLV
jgi:hypothetical protein